MDFNTRGFISVAEALIESIEGVTQSGVAEILKKCHRTFLKTKDLESTLKLFAKECSFLFFRHPNYLLLAGEAHLLALKIKAAPTFSSATQILKSRLDPNYYDFVMKNSRKLDEICASENESTRGYCSIRTLEEQYLASFGSLIVETPNTMYMRVATFLFYPDLVMIEETFKDLVRGNYSCASPTMSNSGMKNPQLSSCFLITTQDSLPAIEKSWAMCSQISSAGGGIGYDMSQLRTSNIADSSRKPATQAQWLQVIQSVLAAIHQRSRCGSATVFQKIWHSAIEEFISARDKEMPESQRAVKLTYGIMFCDLFFWSVIDDKDWYLFCPHKAPMLNELWGKDFEREYHRLVEEGKYERVVKARDLFQHITEMWAKESMPFAANIDAINRKANLSEGDIIRTLNLCMEIAQVTNEEEVSPCNLSSVSLCECVAQGPDGPYFDFGKLERLTKHVVKIVNNLIDRSHFPDLVPQIRSSCDLRRTMGIGVQGWANVFARLGMPLVVIHNGKKVINPRAKEINFWMFECMYATCVQESVELAKKFGPYKKFAGSKASKGILQPDEWVKEFEDGYSTVDPQTLPKSRYSPAFWDTLREDSKTFGWRNQFFIALMPTATTAHILNNNECFEPFTQMIYSRTLQSGQYPFIVRECFDDLYKLGIWKSKTVTKIYRSGGTLQCLNVDDYPEEIRSSLEQIKLRYLTAYEIPMEIQIEFATDRNRFVCQSSSFNWFVEKPVADLYYRLVMKAWAEGNKTLLYYIKSRPPRDPIKFAKIHIPENEEVCQGCVV